MSSEAQTFWKWLNKESQSRVIVRILFHVNSHSDTLNLFGSDIHLFYRTANSPLYHLYQTFTEAFTEDKIQPRVVCGALAEEEFLALATGWSRQRCENWLGHGQIVAIKRTAVSTSPCEIGFLVREELSKLYGFLIAEADISTISHLPLALERLNGLRADLRKKSLQLQRSMREYTDQL